MRFLGLGRIGHGLTRAKRPDLKISVRGGCDSGHSSADPYSVTAWSVINPGIST